MTIELYDDGSKQSETLRRKRAVEAALEVIKSVGQDKPEGKLSYHFDRLSEYADRIQEALKVKKVRM
jgi:hypothetical protein